VLDQRLRYRAAPPSRRPAVEVAMADHDQVRLDAAGVFGDLVHRLADDHLAADHLAPFLAHARDAVLQHGPEGGALLLLGPPVRPSGPSKERQNEDQETAVDR